MFKFGVEGNLMNFIKVTDKKLIVEKSGKDNSYIKINIETINAIYMAINNNQNLENPEWNIYVMTDSDDKVLICNSNNEFTARNEFRNLTSRLKKVDLNFKNYGSKCINMKKVISVGWHKVPFKYIACVDFKKGSLKFRTFSEEFDKLIEDWGKVDKTTTL